MHYKTVFLAISTLFAAGTVSASALPQEYPSNCLEQDSPCDIGYGLLCCNKDGHPQEGIVSQ